MRKTVLGIAAAALLAGGTFSTEADARHRSHRWVGPAIAAGIALPFLAAAASSSYGYGYGYPAYGYGWGYPAYGYGFGYPSYAYAGFPGFFGFGGFPGFGWGHHGFHRHGFHRHRHVIVRRGHRYR